MGPATAGWRPILEKRLADKLDTIESGDNTPRGQQTAGLTRALWVFFGEMKTAIVLLLVLAFISIIGTVIRQNASPDEYIALYGPRSYAAIKYLGLANVYDSSLYRLLLALVGINLVVCGINRFGITWRRVFQPKVSVDAKAIRGMQRSETLSSAGTLDDVAGKAAAAVRSRYYRVIKSTDTGDVVLLAAKGALNLWGPYLTHLSLLVIFLGAILGNMLGFNGFTGIDEGGSTSVYVVNGDQKESNLGFRVALRKFEIDYDAAHNPTAYKSDLAIYEGDRLAAEKVIDVNHPLTYKGISFFQSDYGLSGLVIKITAPNGESMHVPFDLSTENGPHGKMYVIAGEPFKEAKIGGKTLTVFVHDFMADYSSESGAPMSFLPLNPAAKILINDRLPEYKGMDAWSRLGWLEEGKSAPYKGFVVTLEEVVDYTGLQVSRNPGLPIIYLGFCLLLAGVFLSFYVPHRVMRLRITAQEHGVTLVIGASSKDVSSVFDKDFDRIRGAVS